MGILEIFLISVGLAMDAFAISICKGLSMKKINIKKVIIIAIYFGIFQAIMPLIGYFIGVKFENLITQIDHWVAFILLIFIGINMIIEAFSKNKDIKEEDDDISFKTMIILAIATSIDALAVRNYICIFRYKYYYINNYNRNCNICAFNNRSINRKQVWK